jgi:hypothetical protein
MITQRFQRSRSANRPIARTLGLAGGALAVVALGFAWWPAALAQTPAAGRAQPMITQAVNDANLTLLGGNTRPEARDAAKDRGRLDDATPMPHLMLQLRRSAAQEQALQTLLDQLHDPNSPNYHHWLSPNEIGAQFGPAASDISTVTNWLTQHGFTVDTVYPNGMAIEFSGTAGQVSAAFHTEIHNLLVNGVTHFANTTDPQIPTALAPVVAGVVSLSNFRPQPQAVRKPQAAGEFTRSGNYYITPQDLATIYNFNQAFSGGITGKGQTIYLVEDSDIYTNNGAVNDWATFRSGFGIPVANYPGASLTTIHPNNCADPGVNGDDAEAIIDAEYASAAAPSAAIVMAVCNNFVPMLQFMFNNPANFPPAIMSISYGECEALNGAATNAAYRNVYQTGTAAGWSIYVSAGDQAAGGCNFGGQTVTDGVAVNGLGSTIYNVAVGGTDFGDTYANQNSTYWNAGNTATFGSARSYIPEIPWNTTCGSQLLANNQGFATTYGASGLCNSNLIVNQNPFYLENWAGSGGQSLCAQGTPSVSGVISGSCTGWPKPSWQSGLFGNPPDTVRDLPDVSMFASFGPWHHAYAICYSDTTVENNQPRNGTGTVCDGTAANWSTGWGGTSFGSPIWAGIQALINQYTGSVQGNPNPVLYTLAATEYGASGNSGCNSSNGNTVSAACVFYDVTLGDMVAPCTGPYSCYLPSGTYGVMSTNPNAYAPAFTTGPGWDFATGIGTVNVYNLITNWAASGGGNAGLTISVTGNGTVASNPSGINCPSTCSHTFSGGTPVTLTPTPSSGWAFSSWGGACSGSGGCTVSMNAAESVTATFVQNVTLVLTVTVAGSGTVTSSPSGINCPSMCSASFAAGSQVTLNPTPANNWGFSGWSGACNGPDPCVVTMNSAQSVTATFEMEQDTLNVSVAGNGTVTSSPSGINCPSLCTANYTTGTSVMLTATPTAGATFSSWGGACSGNGACSVTINQIESVTAMFTSSGGGGPSSQTFVSASLGSDSNPCTRISPCLTFAAALAQTTAGGEINCLDQGDFGTLTITSAISVICGGFGEAGVLVSGTNGIVVAAGPSDTVVLEGLDIEGLGTGLDGVKVQSGLKVSVRNTKIHHFVGNGINMASSTSGARLFVEDSFIFQNGTLNSAPLTGGVNVNGTANVGLIVDAVVDTNQNFAVQASGASNAVTLTRTFLSGSPNGINLVSGGTSICFGPSNVIAGTFTCTTSKAF